MGSPSARLGDQSNYSHVVAAIARRTTEIVNRLGGVSEQELLAPSQLPGWSRLTIVCHLRYGAEALTAMTQATLNDSPTSYYPEGRDRQGEGPHAVVAALGEVGETLQRLWASLGEREWQRVVVEPPDNSDLGAIPLGRLPLLRATEVEVHGTDLGVGLDEWDTECVRLVLAMRLDWLN
jgi:maleylpyruvate isomerase